MTEPDDNQPVDPLTVGELITLQEAAEYAGLGQHTLHGYIKRGRLKAIRKGWMWLTTHAAIDEYIRTREMSRVPKDRR